MQKRSERHSRQKRPFHKKIVIAVIIAITIPLSSLTVLVADADENITSILKDWFTKQETDAIEEIDNSISKVQDEQVKRLKSTIKDMLDEQKEEMNTIVDTEKQKRTESLEAYTDELIAEFKEEYPDTIELPTSELDNTIETAKKQMEKTIEEAVASESDIEESDDKGKEMND